MLTCNACVRKTIRIVFADLVETTPILTRHHHRRLIAGSSPQSQSWLRRTLASSAEPVVSTPATAPAPHPRNLMPRRTKPERQTVAAQPIFDERSLEKELMYLKDPLKLAEHVNGLLLKDHFEKALELTRRACRDMACTVSWNHLINYSMRKGTVNIALKLYNEMKKRAQVPDGRTYTLLFRGFAAHPEFSSSLPRALSLYQSMFAETCPVKPSLIHTNAVLNVCARAMDVDAMLGVAAKLPVRGRGAPDNFTFSTILNAVRTAAWQNSLDLSLEEKVRSRQQATDQGRRIWGEVANRWRHGDLVMDEQLVCAVGRLLLVGYHKRDYDDVLALVEQTMGIPRQAVRIENEKDEMKSSSRDRYQQPIRKIAEPKTIDSTREEESTELQPASGEVENEKGGEEDISGKEFDALDDTQKIIHARPGCNTLSMVLDACIRLYAFRPAQDYWGLLTDPKGKFNICPDVENYHMYLRLLRAQRASRLCAEMLEEMRYRMADGTKLLQPKTFRIALSTCVRDSKNPKVLAHASRLVRIMQDTLDTPDVKALETYLDTMGAWPRPWKSMMEVLRTCTTSVQNLRSFVSYGEEIARQDWQRQNEEDLIRLVRKLVGAYDTAIAQGRGAMNQEEMGFCLEQRNTLSSWVTRMIQMGRGNRSGKDKRGHDEAEEVYDDVGRSVDEGVGSEQSSESVHDDGSRNRNGRWSSSKSRGNNAPGTDRPIRSDDAATNQEKRKPFLGTTYRPSIIHEQRQLASVGKGENVEEERSYRPSDSFRRPTREGGMRKRLDRAREILREKDLLEDEKW